eukprot:403339809
MKSIYIVISAIACTMTVLFQFAKSQCHFNYPRYFEKPDSIISYYALDQDLSGNTLVGGSIKNIEMPNAAQSYPFVAYYDSERISEKAVIALQNQVTYKTMFLFIYTNDGSIISKDLDNTFGVDSFIDGIEQNGLIMDGFYNAYFAGNTYSPTTPSNLVLIGKMSAANPNTLWGITDVTNPFRSISTGLVFGSSSYYIYALTNYHNSIGDLSEFVIHKIQSSSGSRVQSFSFGIGTDLSMVESQIGDAHVLHIAGKDYLSGCGQFIDAVTQNTFVFQLQIDNSSHSLQQSHITKFNFFQKCMAVKTMPSTQIVSLFYDEYENEFNLYTFKNVSSSYSTMIRLNITYSALSTFFDAMFLQQSEDFVFVGDSLLTGPYRRALISTSLTDQLCDFGQHIEIDEQPQETVIFTPSQFYQVSYSLDSQPCFFVQETTSTYTQQYLHFETYGVLETDACPTRIFTGSVTYSGDQYKVQYLMDSLDFQYEISFLFTGDENCMGGSIRSYEVSDQQGAINAVSFSFDDSLEQIVVWAIDQLPSINFYQVNCRFVDGQIQISCSQYILYQLVQGPH